MANEIVKYNSRFNDLALRSFNKKELDILMALFQQLKEKGTQEILLSFNKIKELINDPNEKSIEIGNWLKLVGEKLVKLSFTYEDNKTWAIFSLFPTYAINYEDKNIRIGVNSNFKYILNNFSSFTAFELEEFVNFNSIYTKEFFRRMKQFQKSGFWEVSIDKFRELMNIPKNYKIYNINQKVINPILKEINSLLDAQGNLKYNLTVQEKKEGNGIGRPRIVGYRFTFRKNIYKGVTNKQDIALVQALANSYINQLICLDYNVQEIYKIINLFYDDGYVVECENTETLKLVTTKFQGPVDRISELSQWLESRKENYKFNFEN